MKNKIAQIIFLLAIVFLPFANNAQTVKKISLNFNTKTLGNGVSELEKIKEGNFYQVEVININMNLYNVSFQAKDTIFQSQALPALTFPSVATDALKSLLADVSFNIDSAVRKIKELPQTSMPQLFKADGRIKPVKPTEKKDADESEKISVAAYLNTEKEKVDKHLKSLQDIKEKCEGMFYKINLFTVRSLISDNSNATYKSLTSDINNCTIDGLEKDFFANRNLIFIKQKEALLDNESYAAFSTKDDIAAIIGKDTSMKVKDAVIKKSYDFIIKCLTAIDSGTNNDKSVSILNNLVQLENNSSNSYLSLPIQFKNDQTQFTLSITPKDTKSGLQSYAMPLSFPLNKRGYLAIGLSFYGSSLYDEAYSFLTTKIDTVTSYSLIQEKPGDAEIGMATLLRYGTKLCNSTTGIHATFGPGVTLTNKMRMRLLFGSGLSFGKVHMLSIDFGGIAGYVNRLSNVLHINEKYEQIPSSTTVSQLNVGFFLSIGYLYRF